MTTARFVASLIAWAIAAYLAISLLGWVLGG